MLPTLSGHRLGKDFGGVMKLGFGVLLRGVRFGAQTPSEAGYPRTFYEGFNDPAWAPFWGTFFWERSLELRIRYFMGLLWLVCIGLHRYASLVCDCFHEPTLISIERCMLALVCMVCTVVCI